MSKNLDFNSDKLYTYIEKTSKMYLIGDSSFYELYKFNLLKWSNKCIAEINKNISILDKDKQGSYLEFVKSEINSELQFAMDNFFLDSYLVKYKLVIEDFPFFSNIKIKALLKRDFSDENLYKNEATYKDAFMIKRMQSDFYRYAIFVETNKILDLVNKLKGISFADDVIFKSEKSKQIFQDLLKFLKINDVSTRGNKAKIAGIWQVDSSKRVIFKDSTEKKQYLDYINLTFDSSFTTKSFSDGSNHILAIEKWMQNYLF